MSEREVLWRAAAELAAGDAAGALATVARRRGSAPMASDAKMLIQPDGARVGTIVGGCLEADVAAQALEALAQRRPRRVRHLLNADTAGDLGLSCGGTVEFFLEPVVTGAQAATLYAAVGDAIGERRDVAVFTAVEWEHGPRKAARVADRVVAIGDWAGAPPALDAQPADLDARGLFAERIPRAPRLLLFGAGHVAREIARAAAGTDFHVVVVDDRAEFANRDRFPTVRDVIVADLRQALDRLALDGDDFVIACTRGHAMDAVVIERTAGSGARYVGMLGSRRKREVIGRALERAGTSRAALERVKVPIGEPIGADTPGEIGIAVMAELIRLRRLPPEPGE